MVNPPRQTMEDYCKRTDTGRISLGFQLANPVTFNIKNVVLVGLRDNQFDGSVIRDPWVHLIHFLRDLFSMQTRWSNRESYQVEVVWIFFNWKGKRLTTLFTWWNHSNLDWVRRWALEIFFITFLFVERISPQLMYRVIPNISMTHVKDLNWY